MKNRIKHLLDELMGVTLARDHYYVNAARMHVRVSADTAREIERQLELDPAPAWIVFRDLSGSRIRLRAEQINFVAESTEAQRAKDREYDRAMDDEEQDDRPTFE